MKKIDLFCLLTPIKVTLISFVLALFISFLFIKISPPAEEYLDELNLGVLRIYLAMIVGNFLASLFSISIALNTTESVRDNFWLSLLTFYMPALLMLPFVLSMSLNVSLFVYFIVPIPFLIPQTYYFIRFRKRLKSGEIINDFGKK